MTSMRTWRSDRGSAADHGTLGSDAGFTLLEVLGALAVFGVVAAGLAANVVSVVKWNRTSHGVSVATLLAQDLVEQLRALDPSANPAALTAGTHTDGNNPLTPSGVAGGRYTRTWTVTRDSPAPALSTVVVSVSWTDGATRTVRVTALLCQTPTCA
jgi:prepilin-type N-terminal cleavage/methylation domain-containing protein